jgi:lipid-binding SYLF domain-containing protein
MRAMTGPGRRILRAPIGGLMTLFCLGLHACAAGPPVSPADHRAAIRQMASETLAQLYQSNPGTHAAIQSAAGYAVFSDIGMKMFYGGAAHGGGVAVNNATKHETFMKMFELQPGYGFGVENFRNVFVFDAADAFSQFVDSGWEFGANAMAAAQQGTQGDSAAGGVVVSPGVTMYQLTQDGVIAGISLTGAKYYKDNALN